MAVRRALFAMGLRYRVDRALVVGLRRRADIVFSREKVAVFVDGCFWHSCPRHGTNPKANGPWWSAKLKQNQRRDADTNCRLRRAGWHVERTWEHEEPSLAARRIARIVVERRRGAVASSHQTVDPVFGDTAFLHRPPR